MKNQIPCEDCLTLSMCKARLNGGTMMDLMCLSDQCSHLRAFLFPKSETGEPTGHVDLVTQIENYLCTNIIYNGEPF